MVWTVVFAVFKPSFEFQARFMNSMYYLFIKEWLDVFPREQFHFIKMEDYVTRKEDVLNRVFKFLGVSKYACIYINFTIV